MVKQLLQLLICFQVIFGVSIGSGAASEREPKQSVQYEDFQTDVWWSESMKWALEMDVVQGYKVKNSDITKWFVYPEKIITEAEYLTLLLRYLAAEELANTKISGTHWAANAYHLAKQYGLPLQKEANQPIRLATMARLTVAATTGKNVSGQEAVNGLIENGFMLFENSSLNETVTRSESIVLIKYLFDQNFTELKKMEIQDPIADPPSRDQN